MSILSKIIYDSLCINILNVKRILIDVITSLSLSEPSCSSTEKECVFIGHHHQLKCDITRRTMIPLQKHEIWQYIENAQIIMI